MRSGSPPLLPSGFSSSWAERRIDWACVRIQPGICQRAYLASGLNTSLACSFELHLVSKFPMNIRSLEISRYLDDHRLAPDDGRVQPTYRQLNSTYWTLPARPTCSISPVGRSSARSTGQEETSALASVTSSLVPNILNVVLSGSMAPKSGTSAR